MQLKGLISKVQKQHIILIIAIVIGISIMLYVTAPKEPRFVLEGSIPGNGYDPAEWSKVYPLEYESWQKTKEMQPKGKSFYKKVWDTDTIMYDMLPYLSLHTLINSFIRHYRLKEIP